MINRNENISPWYVFLVNLYPIFETVFTIYRRLIWKKQNPGLPDGIHIHTLIFKRISTANLLRIKNLIPINTNALTSVISLMLGLIAIIPASLFWYSSSILIICTLFFSLIYLLIYFLIIKFKVQKYLK